MFPSAPSNHRALLLATNVFHLSFLFLYRSFWKRVLAVYDFKGEYVA